jgi:OOP family OmpA-OmpF porin
MKRSLTFLLLSTCSLHAADPAKVVPASQILQKLDAEVIYDKDASGKDLTVEEEKEVARQTRQIPLSSIRFKLNSTELADAASTAQIRELGAALADPTLKDAIITLEGHTCDLGEDAANAVLSQRRAQAVRDILVQWFQIPAQRLRIQGRGERAPLVTNTDETARAQNRRVTIIRESD